MKIVHSITALVLALLIANPLCCCAAETAKSDDVRSCCSGKVEQQDDREPHICACKSKQPRTEVKEVSWLTDLGALAEPVAYDLELPILAGSDVTLSMIPMELGSDPPRWMLARFSRWLL